MRESAIYLVSFLARRANHTCNFKLCQHSYSGFLLILEEYIKVSHCTNRSSNSHSILIMSALNKRWRATRGKGKEKVQLRVVFALSRYYVYDVSSNAVDYQCDISFVSLPISCRCVLVLGSSR